MRLLAILVFALSACESQGMPLPFSREETATSASQVRSTTIDAIQDAIAAQHNRPIHLGAALWSASYKNIIGSDDISLNQADYPADVVSASCELTPFLIPGDTIKEFTVRFWNGTTPTAGTLQWWLHRDLIDVNGGSDIHASAVILTNVGAAQAFRNETEAIGHVVEVGYFYRLIVLIDNTAAADDVALRGGTLVIGT